MLRTCAACDRLFHGPVSRPWYGQDLTKRLHQSNTLPTHTTPLCTAVTHNLNKKLETAAADKSDIRKRLAELEGSIGSKQTTAASAGSYTVLHLLIVAILSFLIGLLMQTQLPALQHVLGGGR